MLVWFSLRRSTRHLFQNKLAIPPPSFLLVTCHQIFNLKHNFSRSSSTASNKKVFSKQSLMSLEAYKLEDEKVSILEQSTGEKWTPLFRQNCTFPPEIFTQVMLNLIRNPNINSNKLFRADISFDKLYTSAENFDTNNISIKPRITQFKNFDLKTVMVRTMIPRNAQLDKPLDQTCLIYQRTKESGDIETLVVYQPHISSAAEAPFYHPAVHGIGHLHIYNPQTKEGIISIHYSYFPPNTSIPSTPKSELEVNSESEKLTRTAQHLLSVLHKHGQGTAAGYKKRVHHDLIIPQATLQNTYAILKAKYAKPLITNWVEVTDPTKHVFEDLSIAAFLIELWSDMYKDRQRFPGFVDIGCGNGLLVHILREEGYKGWGFDARRRKSWDTYSEKTQENLKELVLIPSIIQTSTSTSTSTTTTASLSSSPETHENQQDPTPGIHNGNFPPGTFIISNHADELTPWTPILATLSKSPFIAIPCCSHSLSGARFRAPPSKEKGVSNSAYASLVGWVEKLAGDCGWVVEKEMLRIPSTRNTCLVGRRWVGVEDVIDNGGDGEREEMMRELVKTYGGAEGWEENAMKLVKGATRGH